MQRIVTTYSVVDWSPDGAVVTKTRLPAADARGRFRRELRVNQLLCSCRLPVPTPALVAHDTQRRSLTFSAVRGEPVGPKYPRALSTAQLDAIIGLGKQLRAYNPKRHWLRRFNSASRLTAARRAGLLSTDDTAALLAIAKRVDTRLRFAHGDLTARNVIDGPDGTTLIDWEWAGLYPDGYELAFLWFSLVDLENCRLRVEAAVDTDEAAFLLSALLIQLWHLQWATLGEFRSKHLATRDALVRRLVA